MKTEEVLCLSTLEGLHMISHGNETGGDGKHAVFTIVEHYSH